MICRMPSELILYARKSNAKVVMILTGRGQMHIRKCIYILGPIKRERIISVVIF